jgi:hypothetical protein
VGLGDGDLLVRTWTSLQVRDVCAVQTAADSRQVAVCQNVVTVKIFHINWTSHKTSRRWLSSRMLRRVVLEHNWRFRGAYFRWVIATGGSKHLWNVDQLLLDGATSQKAVIFIIVAVRTWNFNKKKVDAVRLSSFDCVFLLVTKYSYVI